MTESTSPEGTATDTALSFDDGVEALGNLLADDSAGETGTKVEANNEEAEVDAETPEEEGEGAEDAADDDDEDQQQDEDEDGEEREIKGGQFAPKNAKVTLRDGTIITVADLKRGYASDTEREEFGRLRAEVKEIGSERETLAKHRAELGNIANALKQEREALLQYGQRKLPKPPSRELAREDPLAYIEAKAEYEDEIKAIRQLALQRQADTGRQTEAQKKQAEQSRAQEAARLLEAMPELREPKVYETFWTDASNTIAEKYGYSAQELAKVATDHRLYPMMRDLVKYHKALKGTEKVKQDIQAKPKVMGASRRMDPKAKTSREAQARREQLAKTGSFEAGVASLMDLDF